MIQTTRPKILVADDNARLVQALSLQLQHAGYDVIGVVDGYNALARAVAEGLDLMILDVNMPAASGFAVVERAMSASSGTRPPVIYITGDTSDQTFEKALQLGAYTVVHKPIRIRTLLEAVANALDRAASQPTM